MKLYYSVSFLSFKNITARFIIANNVVLAEDECLLLEVCMLPPSSHELVGAPAHHLARITKKPFHDVGVQRAGCNALPFLYAVDLDRGDMREQQSSNAEPRFICKEIPRVCAL